jgi:hypothetical protein
MRTWWELNRNTLGTDPNKQKIPPSSTQKYQSENGKFQTGVLYHCPQ